ncbi:MAG: tandem-95 repeat protein [Bacteroidales bacterium]|nr:tandem-95 repeat protein [Bacteroidales bacterium]
MMPKSLNDTIELNEDESIVGYNFISNDFDVEGNAIVVSINPVSNVRNGKALLYATGLVEYTPIKDFNGIDSLEYQICDNGSPIACSSAKIYFKVKSVNDAPVAKRNIFTLNEDAIDASINLLLNDSDIENDAIIIKTIPVVDAKNGSVVINANGILEYIPNINFYGRDTLVYEICDTGLYRKCDTAIVYINVISINDRPLVVGENYILNEDESILNVNLLENDTDIENNSLLINTVALDQTQNGQLFIYQNGEFSYFPNKDFNGSDRFVYEVCDNGIPSLCSFDTVAITVTPTNDKPIAVPDFEYIEPGGEILVVDVQHNDFDVDNLLLKTSIVDSPKYGSVLVLNSDSIVYVSHITYEGFDTVVYQVCDDALISLCDTTQLIISTVSGELPPVLGDDVVVLQEDKSTFIKVLSNDYDPNGDPLNLTLVKPPLNGIAIIDSNKDILYTPKLNFYGIDSFYYEACDTTFIPLCSSAKVLIWVQNINDKPIAEDDNLSVNEGDSIVAYNLLENDIDFDKNQLLISINPVVSVENGSLKISSDGSFSYKPNPFFNGQDNFTYRLCDNGTPVLCDTGVVSINVINVFDAPVAVNDTILILEEEEIQFFDVLLNDIDIDGTGITINTNPVSFSGKGKVSISPQGLLNFTAAKNYFGHAIVQYEICNLISPSLCNIGQIHIYIGNTNDAPIAVEDVYFFDENFTVSENLIDNDIDPDEDELALSILPVISPVNGNLTLFSDGGFEYIPLQNFSGIDSFQYSVCDNYLPRMCDTGTVILNIQPLNDAPEASNYTIVGEEDNILSGNLLSSVFDQDSYNFQFSLVDNSSNGEVLLTENAEFTFNPHLDFNGLEIIKYSVCDDGIPVKCDTASIIITVTPIPDAPRVLVDTTIYYVTSKDVIKHKVTAYDPENDDFDVVSISYKSGTGKVTGLFDGDSTVSYTPTLGVDETDTVVFVVCDAVGFCSEVVVIYIVSLDNVKFVTNNDDFSIFEDNIGYFNLLANDYNVALQQVDLRIIEEPKNASVLIINNDSVKITPFTNFYGVDTLIYQVCSESNPDICDTAICVITVASQNDAPILSKQVINHTVRSDREFKLKISATDPDRDEIDVIELQSQTGKYKISGFDDNDTAIKILPISSFVDNDTIRVSVCDVYDFCVPQTIIISYSEVNVAPIAVNDTIELIEDNIISIYNIVENDIDQNLDKLEIVFIKEAKHGVVKSISDSSISYIPNSNFHGKDSVDYFVCDQAPECRFGRIYFIVSPVNDPPRFKDSIYVIDVLLDTDTTYCEVNSTVTDSEGDIWYISNITEPKHGELYLDNISNCFRYVSPSKFIENDSIYVAVKDSFGAADSALFVFKIHPPDPNKVPIANNDFFHVFSKDTILSVLDNDILTIGFTIKLKSNLEKIVLQTNKSILYKPELAACGLYSIEYSLCNSYDSCTDAKVYIQVTPKDSDGDMIPDFIEQMSNSEIIKIPVISGTLNSNKDSDFDGIPDYLDLDSDNDGIKDSYESGIVISGCDYTLRDSDKDLTPDYLDLDSDNDLIADAIELGNSATGYPIDTDTDTIPDYLDLDSDNDGKLDLDEGVLDCDRDGIQNYIDNNDECDFVFIPDMFTPNGDGYNDYFRIDGLEDFPENYLIIYNRWEHIVYEKENYENDWNGFATSALIDGSKLPEGTYFYILELKSIEKVFKGSVYIKK